MPGPHYVGKAGQLAVMAELAHRGYNVSMPEIDIGDDIFVVNDGTGQMSRIQVKTSVARQRQTSYSAQFRIRETALTVALQPDPYFVFVVRNGGGWKFITIERATLNHYVQNLNMGTKSVASGQNWVNLYFSFKENELKCSKQVMTQFLDVWPIWPLL
jgi:hypothetical protein